MLKWDNAPANYGAFFDGSEVRLRFYFAVGCYPLAQIVRTQGKIGAILEEACQKYCANCFWNSHLLFDAFRMDGLYLAFEVCGNGF